MANEIRRRVDFAAGGLNAGLTTGATTMTSDGLQDLPALAADEYFPLSLYRLDAFGRVTQKEVVHMTAHSAAAGSGTIVRAREGTTAQAWNAGDRWSLTDLAIDNTIICKSSTRPATPFEGMEIYERDTGRRLMWDGAAWVLPRNVAGGYLVGDLADMAHGNAMALSKSAPESVWKTSAAIQTFANRRYKISGYVSTSNGGTWIYTELKIRRGTTTAGTMVSRMYYPRTGWQTMQVVAWDVPGAQASQQWCMTHQLDNGAAGPVTDLFGASGLIVEDVGAA